MFVRIKPALSATMIALAATFFLSVGSALADSSSDNHVDYRTPAAGESSFDNPSDGYVKDWRTSVPREDYEDTEFGDIIYNEASTPTKLEILRLLSKETPSMIVFLTAVSMGLDIESVLQAAVKYQPEKGRDLAASAVNILPLISESSMTFYSGYELEDLEREDETEPYRVQEVVDRFFEDREVLKPYPDWFEGQYHFLASAAELKSLIPAQEGVRWYRTKSTEDVSRRPVFVSLYEADKTILVDSEDRITEALAEDSEALLPVVFVFNHLKERAVDQLVDYPKTIRGVQEAYADRGLMLTPTPEWQLGEYHLYAELDEFAKIFNLPTEEDFEPAAWDKLIAEAEDYSVTNTSFLFTILGGGDNESASTKQHQLNLLAQANTGSNPDVVPWTDPRESGDFPYVAPEDGPAMTLKSIMGEGVIFNRPDLIAALKALGVVSVPVVFHYIDDARVKPFIRTPRALIQSVLGLGRQPTTVGVTGVVTPPPVTPPPVTPPQVCASPPCTEEDDAE